MDVSLAVAAEIPAGGAALDQVVIATAGVGFITSLIVGLAVAHRTRRTTLLQRAADAAGRRLDAPGWVALPTLMTASSLIIALIGFLWDVALHAGQGRDEGPLANPAHYFILVGLLLLFCAGMLAMALPLDEKPGPASIRITRTWHAPIGGVLIAGAGLYALIGFPLDDVWHRIFGQDVTLWGPTHLMLIGGAGFSLVGVLVLMREGEAAMGRRETSPTRLFIMRCQAFGGLLIGLCVFQAEYDFGIQQFRQVLHPMMIAAAGGLALVAARLYIGRGGALGVAGFFLAMRGLVALIVGPVLGQAEVWFPLFLGQALLIELLASTRLVRRPVVFGAVGGLLIATIGMVTEALWIAAIFPLPWTPDMWLEGLLMTVPVGIAAGACGGLLYLGLVGRLPTPGVARTVLVAGVLVLGAATANGLMATVPDDAQASVRLTPAGSGVNGDQVHAEVELDPSSLVDDPTWVQITSWQGGGEGVVVDRLERTGEGTYRTTRPVPVTGSWKTILRVHDGRMLAAVPIYLPADGAIDAPEIPAESAFTRDFVPEIELLQRERNLDVPGWTWTVACLVVLALSLLLIAALAWGVARVGRRLETTPQDADAGEPATPQPVGT